MQVVRSILPSILAQRLMILKGQFDALSLAIYGQVISDLVPPSEGTANSALKTIASVESKTLSASVNPASSAEPTFLARNLLSLLDDSPPLSLITKLMFCLKPDNDDWDEPDFPYLFADFEQDIFQTNPKVDGDEAVNGEYGVNFDFEEALDAMSKPVSDSVSEDALTKFAQIVADGIGPKTNSQAFYIAKLFKLSACQRPSLALALCQAIDTVDVFDAESLDEDTLLHLLDAAANADIARYLNTDSFLSILTEFQSSSFSALHPKTAKQAAERLATRLQAWDIFEDALSNTQADFAAASAMLRDIGSGEQSLGIWLASMMGHDDLVTKLAENPLYPNSGGAYPKLFVRNGLNNTIGGMGLGGALSHDEFIAFVRAFIGVASVLAVWAWSDSLGNNVCRERTLGVLRLWQGTDYREIVNYLLLLRQFTLRLKWITANDTPRKSGIFGEQILADILDEPEAALNNDLVQTILSLKQPLSHISESDRLSMRKIALVVEDGLPAAIEELTRPSAHPLSYRRLRTLRVSVALVERELAEDPQKGDWTILQTLWDEQSTALIPRLADLLTETAQDLNGHFLITSPFPTQQQSSSATSLPQVLSQLFSLAEDILTLLLHLVLVPGSSSSSLPLGSGSAPFAFSLTSYTLRSLVLGVADVFACTDAADTIYAQGTPACISAQSARQVCLEFVRRASSCGPRGITIEPIGGKSGAEIVMYVLLKHSVASAGRDPAYHLLQMFALIDHILPESSSNGMAMGGEPTEDEKEGEKQKEHWVVDVLPNVLEETQGFFRQLDVENKVHLLRRLVRLG
ncbi:hypothetical protein BT96DRAFT_394283 [Gymnopus androsaceus JB14]|uniref:Uncharacterized protein n=1 Tax=Gymnopus androsaceus JB14 TaxID=1447944 RepID=A0A6A4I306_9AGAR|nr:hypothetical protein BT96DRAFT_394283 [Gymnopus androsaceus JB14]